MTGIVLLGQVAAILRTLEVDCTRCERHGRLSTARLLAEHGAQTPIPKLLRRLASDCPRMAAQQWHDVWGVYYRGLAKLKL